MNEGITRLRQLEQAATPGPWRVHNGDQLIGPNEEDILGCGEGREPYVTNNADAAMIAFARNALPSLLAIAEAAEILEHTR